MRTLAIAAFIFLALAPIACLPAGVALADQVSSGNNVNQQTSGGTNTGITLINPLGSGTSIPTLLADILKFVVYIGSIVVILMLVYVGYMFVDARGVPAKITGAKEALKWTVIGALILLGAQAISLGIQATVQAISVGS